MLTALNLNAVPWHSLAITVLIWYATSSRHGPRRLTRACPRRSDALDLGLPLLFLAAGSKADRTGQTVSAAGDSASRIPAARGRSPGLVFRCHAGRWH